MGPLPPSASVGPMQPRLPPTPPLHKTGPRRARSLVAVARSTLRMLFAHRACVLNETAHADLPDCTPRPIGPREMLRIAKEVRLRISELYNRVLEVDQRGGVTVDYIKLVHSVDFRRYLDSTKRLRFVDPSRLKERERLAFFLNLYNALMIHGIARLPRPKTRFERLQMYNTAAYNIGGRIYTLNDIEHGVLRANRESVGPFAMTQFEEGDARALCALRSVDPRIHFALNCGARSCPAIRYYCPENIDESLNAATRNFLLDMKVNKEERTVVASQILKWYKDDFGAGGIDDVLRWTLPYLEEQKRQDLEALLDEHESGAAPLKVEFATYDWSFNDAVC